MTIAQRHFTQLAQMLKRTREQVRDEFAPEEIRGAMDIITVMEHSLILFCEAESPMFDRAKFQEAAKL